VGRILNEFAFTKPLAGFLLETLAAPVIAFLKTGVDELPNLLTILFIYILTRFILKLTLLVFRNIEVGLIQIRGFDKRWIWPTHRIVRFGVIIVATVTAFPYVPGSQTPAFQGATVLLGLMLTLGAGSIGSNFLSGFVVVYKRGVNVGDRIKVGKKIGYVESMSILDTHLRTFENELVSIPNSVILSSEVVNLTLTDGTKGLLIKVPIGVGYDEAPEVVERLLLIAADKTAAVKRAPKPFVLVPTLGGQDVTYELHAYVKAGSRRIAVRSELNRAILDAFNSAGVQIMSPFYINSPVVPKNSS
ncbi:MAG: mechanosensitive ion channel family protein, partial [Sneathiella sp.]